jgi:hypothetical protein
MTTRRVFCRLTAAYFFLLTQTRCDSFADAVNLGYSTDTLRSTGTGADPATANIDPNAAVALSDTAKSNPYESLKTSPEEIDHGKLQIDWLVKNGGFVHDHLAILHYNNDPVLPYGMFATAPIAAGTTILTIPNHLLIQPTDDTDDICNAARQLHTQLELGDDSFWAPYVNYLKATQPLGLLPVTFTRAGRELLQHVLMHDTPRPLPPESMDWWFLQHCNVQPHEAYAFQLLRQRSWDEIMIPVYDTMSHANGERLNTDCDQVQDADVITVRTTQNIVQGSELFVSYNFYPGSGNLASWYGTPEIFMDFGFVEQYPQRWVFRRTEQLAFELDQDVQTKELVVRWLRNRPAEEDVGWAEASLYRLQGMQISNLLANAANGTGFHPRELRLIEEYYNALVTALKSAIEAADNLATCVYTQGTCPQRPIPYDSLHDEPGPLDSKRGAYTCDAEKTHNFDSYKLIDAVESHYQRMLFYKNEATGDVCSELNGVLLMCNSFLPPHHERKLLVR